ncbi:peptidyl-tRNA hydrolase 2, mitochondrial-like [Microplitis mediator]|uniref:peptidyl-tRNA hydrolase 2, mitochondrial-like n=1 Tax=Microplitis mediator TaxID=375433 RepID=UPI00255579A5|nr:peptidyl-tRNA hydrolase 2, mitochondrial-like [Microplitis mediator]
MGKLLRRLKYLITKGLPKEPYKMVLVVRTDLSMSTGKIAGQCAHAAVECYDLCKNDKINGEYLESWLMVGQPKIVLKTSSEERLKSLASNANNHGLVTAIIKDAGRTQLEPGTISVLGIGPGPNSIVDKVTSHLKLL